MWYETELDKLEQLAVTLKDFTPLDTYLSSAYDSDGEAFYYYKDNVHPMLKSCGEVYDHSIVRIYHNKSEIPNFSFYISNEWSHFVEQLFPDASVQQPAAGWVKSQIRYYAFESTYSYYLAVRSSTHPYEDLYGVSVHADESFFYAPISGEIQTGSLVLILDKEGHVLSSSDQELAGLTLDQLSLESELPLQQMQDRDRVTLSDVEYYLFQRESDNLHIIYLVDHDWVYAAHQKTMVALLLIGGLLMLLAAFLMIRITQNITGHIAVLKEKMTNIDRTRIRTLAGNTRNADTEDEIEQLDLVFTNMMGEIDLLMERTQKQEQKLKDTIITRQQAEIQALQHQIDPHYLFNTLETIRMKLVMKNNREDAEIVKLFAESFRRYVDIRDEFVTLFEEVSFIRKYIRIQNYRLNNKIRFTQVGGTQLMHYKVMKLLLQPLVENAVCHGVEAKANSGEVILRLEKTRDTLEIFVEDDGVGMNQETLAQLRRSVYANQPGRSVGLQNIYRRIRLTYGGRAKMTIESIEGVGTAVQLTLPLDALEGR